MTTLYALKPGFQRMLRPVCRGLAASGVTANQVTIAGAIISIATGVALSWWSANPAIFWLLRRRGGGEHERHYSDGCADSHAGIVAAPDFLRPTAAQKPFTTEERRHRENTEPVMGFPPRSRDIRVKKPNSSLFALFLCCPVVKGL